MLELLKPLWLKVFSYGTIAAVIVLGLFKVRQSGKESIEREQLMETLKEAKISAKVDNNIANIDNDGRNKLYKKWQRD